MRKPKKIECPECDGDIRTLTGYAVKCPHCESELRLNELGLYTPHVPVVSEIEDGAQEFASLKPGQSVRFLPVPEFVIEALNIKGPLTRVTPIREYTNLPTHLKSSPPLYQVPGESKSWNGFDTPQQSQFFRRHYEKGSTTEVSSTISRKRGVS